MKQYVAIVDYGMGNLFSVKKSCEKVGIFAVITSSVRAIEQSSGVILTGVGAFGKAMNTLSSLGLVDTLVNYASSGRPIMGICLGMQLLMSESYEFGHTKGLNIVSGSVIRLDSSAFSGKQVKVPHIGWNRVSCPSCRPGAWMGSLLEGMPDGADMYFVHSYFVKPESRELILAMTDYGANDFTTAIQRDNISAFQFHPECSGVLGLKIYDNFAKQISKQQGSIYAKQ